MARRQSQTERPAVALESLPEGDELLDSTTPRPIDLGVDLAQAARRVQG